jgi:hypothetical protein
MAGVAPGICLAVKVVEMGAARPARVVDVVIAVRCYKAVAFELLALAHYASATAGYHLASSSSCGWMLYNNLFDARDRQLDVRRRVRLVPVKCIRDDVA